MPQLITLANQPILGYQGAVRIASDEATPVAWSFARQQFAWQKTDNKSIPDLIDASAYNHNEILGPRIGNFAMAGPVQPDRGYDTFLNKHWGPRTSTGQMIYDTISMVPIVGGSGVMNATLLFLDTFEMYGQYAVPGEQNMLISAVTGNSCDPDNTLGATAGFTTAITAPATEGLSGKGLSSFARFSAGNGATTSPITYDGLRRFRVVLNNRIQPSEASIVGQPRLMNGYIPGPLMGTLEMEQYTTAGQSLPLTGSQLPITLFIPTGDGTKTLRLDLTATYMSDRTSLAPLQKNVRQCMYSIANVNATNNATAWPMLASYS